MIYLFAPLLAAAADPDNSARMLLDGTPVAGCGGFADLELGLFRHYGTCVPGVTPVVSTVHALQVVASDEIPMEEHDTPLDLVVTPDGVENLTLCPRTVSEVEKVRRGGEWPPSTDAAPWLKRRWMRLDKPTGEMVPDKSVRVETSGFSVDADF